MAAGGARRTRKLGMIMATALVVGNMVGSGDYLLPASLAKYGAISIVGGLAFVHTGHFHPVNPSGQSSLDAVTAAATLTLFAFVGLESATVAAGDVRDPERTVPRATVIGTLLAAGIFVLGQVVVLGVIPGGELAKSTAPFADAASAMFGGWAGTIVAISAVIGTFGALNGWILLQGQVPLAAARDGLFPAVFARTSRSGAPVRGLVISSALMTGLILMNYTASLVDQFTTIILLATLSILVPYTYAAAAQLMLLVTDRARFAGRKLARDGAIASLAFAYTLWAIAGAGADIVLKGFLLLLAGIPVYVLVRRQRERATAAAPTAEPAGPAAEPRPLVLTGGTR